jgi:uncharacterized protein
VLTVLDSNVQISALLFRGETTRIHRAILDGRLLPLLTDPILKEYLRVLAYPKLRLSESEIKYLLDEEIRPWFHRIRENVPASDDCFVNAARVRPGTHLISGDGHILQARDHLPVPVLTARELLDQLEG